MLANIYKFWKHSYFVIFHLFGLNLFVSKNALVFIVFICFYVFFVFPFFWYIILFVLIDIISQIRVI